LLVVAALLLSFGALFNTLLVTVQNLGDRDGIRYINGGKIFFERGSMWYHTPGLRRLGMAPQNIGGHANLRNNDFALFEPLLERLDRMEVDFSLAPGAFLLAVLDHPEPGDEGTLRAVRLTAFDEGEEHFTSAAVRFDQGAVVHRTQLSELGAQLEPGRHRLALEIVGPDRLRVTVNGSSQDIDFPLDGMLPFPALGGGELDLTIHRWRVEGLDSDGRMLDWEQSWTIREVFRRNVTVLLRLALSAWLFLFALPALKVVIEARAPPHRVLVDALLLPRPRAIYGVLCLVPVTPLMLQWLLMLNYIVLAWIGFVAQLREQPASWGVSGGRPGRRSEPDEAPRSWLDRARRPWWLVGACAIALGLGLLAVGQGRLESVSGTQLRSGGGELLLAQQEVRSLQTGQRLALNFPTVAVDALVASFRINLQAGEVARVDLMQSMPTDADVFQVDRQTLIQHVDLDAVVPSGRMLPTLQGVGNPQAPSDRRAGRSGSQRDRDRGPEPPGPGWGGEQESGDGRDRGDNDQQDGGARHGRGRGRHGDGPGDHGRGGDGPGEWGPEGDEHGRGDGPDGRGEGGGPDEGGPSRYALRAISLLLSTDPGIPSELRKGWNFDMVRSARGGWTLTPGEHRVEIRFSDPLVLVLVDGVVVDYRADFHHLFPPGDTGPGARKGLGNRSTIAGLQVLPFSSRITAVGDVSVSAQAASAWSARGVDPLEPLRSAVHSSDRFGTAGTVVLGLGLFLCILALVTGLSFSVGTLTLALRRFCRSHLLFLVCLVLWLLRDTPQGLGLSERQLLQLTLFASVFAAFNLLQVLRATAPSGSGRQTVLAYLLCLVHVVLLFEGVSRVHPDWRHATTTWWNHELSEEHYWVYDPMIRRLNPWFVDMRFKRRDYLGDHEGTRRVVVLGGSQTFGWGIPSEDRMTFSDRLADYLHSLGHHDIEVMNAAFPGVKTTTGLRWLTGPVFDYEPDVVVINFVVNEFMDVDPYRVWSGNHGPESRVSSFAALAWLKRLPRDIHCSHLVQIVLAHSYEILEMEDSLREIVSLARERGTRVVFSVEPTNIYVESQGEVIMRNDADIGAAVAVYERLGRELDVPVYNVLPHFSKEPDNLWFYDTMHMSRLGHGVFARHLASLIDAEVLDPAPPRPSLPARADDVIPSGEAP